MRRLRARMLLAAAALGLLAAGAAADVKTQTIEYRHGKLRLQGYLAYDDSVRGKRPGVLVLHGRRGLREQARQRARQLAGLGYVALAADLYGGGRQASERAGAAKLARALEKDRGLMRARAQAGLDVLKSQPRVDGTKLAAIGFGLGGTACLELARSGAELAAVVSFHGRLDTPNPAEAWNIKAKLLVLHAAEDASVPAGQVAAFQKEMDQARVDWQMITYGGAGRGFADPEGGEGASGTGGSNERAARRSWQAMKLFFAQTIGLPSPEGDGGGIGGFAKDKIAKPVARAGKATGKAVAHAVRWTWGKITD